MDEPINPIQDPVVEKEKISIPSVTVVRGFREYLGESALIVFSVLLALFLTELFNGLHDKQHNNEIIKGLKEELSGNYAMEKEQYAYHLQIVRTIDSALTHPEFQQQIVVNGVLHLEQIITHGVLLHDLNDVAWQVAQQNNIISKIDLKTYSIIADIYANQERIKNTEPEIAKVILSRESRSDANNRITLILLKDNYLGWAIGRAPFLLEKYQKALQALDKY